MYLKKRFDSGGSAYFSGSEIFDFLFFFCFFGFGKDSWVQKLFISRGKKSLFPINDAI